PSARPLTSSRAGPVNDTSGGDVIVEREGLLQRVLGTRADAVGHELAALEEGERGDPGDAEAAGQARLRVDVEPGDLQRAAVLVGELVEDGSHHPTRAAPGGPEVVDDGNVALLDLGCEGGLTDVDGLGHVAPFVGARQAPDACTMVP